MSESLTRIALQVLRASCQEKEKALVCHTSYFVIGSPVWRLLARNSTPFPSSSIPSVPRVALFRQVLLMFMNWLR